MEPSPPSRNQGLNITRNPAHEAIIKKFEEYVRNLSENKHLLRKGEGYCEVLETLIKCHYAVKTVQDFFGLERELKAVEQIFRTLPMLEEHTPQKVFT
jgi:hypothetical protein